MSTSDKSPTTHSYPGGGSHEPASQHETPMPESIGRYLVRSVLGQGGFGCVYLAYDDELNRLVAIKMPHARRISRPEDLKQYMDEARLVANFDHPNIVPVYDVGRTEGKSCYVVSKYIEGGSLAKMNGTPRFSATRVAQILADIAEALGYAHQRGFIHRDVKPSNILIDSSEKPFLCDFGLAIKEEFAGRQGMHGGTPAYMSPEQVRGEGHRIDGRTDVFGLGVVLYEMITGKRAFRGSTDREILERVKHYEPQPPRQVNPSIPKELERICLKAIAKRASERYTTAGDIADDLHCFVESASASAGSVVPGSSAASDVAMVVPPTSARGSDATIQSNSESLSIPVIPKGLRAFDNNDADFFLELLPGPRDRHGIPDSIRFWKVNIEQPDSGQTFAVGVIYGPSGCGKTSLVKAGLLPRLDASVESIYVEAVANETESRLLQALQHRFGPATKDLSLLEILTGIRRGNIGLPGMKTVLFLDQFEQWLHEGKEDSDLAQALRQCDGSRLQCILMVRADFWLSLSRFMADLETPIHDGGNSALVDLFDLRHARSVLTAFGCAFGAIGENRAEVTKDEQAFLKQAVAALAQDGKVVPVRLALFAEMVKARPWTTSALKQVGGAEGVGVAFLEDTFSATTSAPHHRVHEKAAQAVLEALLPEQGSEIRGNMKSYQELLERSGYARRPKDFEQLMRILDNELRLLTPADLDEDDNPSPSTDIEHRYYQLTHDYLVPSLHRWLTRKRKETFAGRAALRLSEASAAWNATRERRHLPTCWQWLSIRFCTTPSEWIDAERKTMGAADRVHILRGFLAGCLLVGAIVTALFISHDLAEKERQRHAIDLVERLLVASTEEVPSIVRALQDYRSLTDDILRRELERARSTGHARRELHARVGLLPVDLNQRDILYERLLDAHVDELPVIIDSLRQHRATLSDKLHSIFQSPSHGDGARLRAACALAEYEPTSPFWNEIGSETARCLVAEPFLLSARWTELLEPAKEHLLDPLGEICRDPAAASSDARSLATQILAEYASDQPAILLNLMIDADPKQFLMLFPTIEPFADQAIGVFEQVLDAKSSPTELPMDRSKLARQQVNAAVALLRLDHGTRVWPLLKTTRKPQLRSYLIHRFAALGVRPQVLADHLGREEDDDIRQALLLSLGEFSPNELSDNERERLVESVSQLHQRTFDSGVHAAAKWMLRQWDRADVLPELGPTLPVGAPDGKRNYYVTGQGQTMIVIDGPVEFLMGSPEGEPHRNDTESQHLRRTSGPFAISSTEVSANQFRVFLDENPSVVHPYTKRYDPQSRRPMFSITWYEAAAYCRWLSEKEGIDEQNMCYPRVEEIKNGVRPFEDYLQRSGYRLPSEAEWEYACRAGASTRHGFGESVDLLPHYAWYLGNSQNQVHDIGLLKPNRFGLFDMHGNVWEWCQEGLRPYGSNVGQASDDVPDLSSIIDGGRRMLRGGAFDYHEASIRAASRKEYPPDLRNNSVGFRIVRSIRPQD